MTCAVIRNQKVTGFNGMWKKAADLILQDVENENEIKRYAVILRINLLIMMGYYLLSLTQSVIMRREAAGTVTVIGFLLCAWMFHATYHNKTELVSYVFNVSLSALIICFGLMFGNMVPVYNFFYLQIILVYAIDYLSFKWKLTWVGGVVALRIGLFVYLMYHPAVYLVEGEEIAVTQIFHILTMCLLLVFTISFSTQDFREMQKKLVSYNRKLKNIASVDPLTGLPNRRSGMEYICEKAKKYQGGETNALTIAIGDIDFFKRVNDTYGHNCGDVVLKTLADIFENFMEGKGKAVRWGGEEFLFIFNDINGDEASFMLSDLRKRVRDVEFRFADDIIKISLTFGVAEYDLRKGADETINEADHKLYIGKENGRDIIIY